MANPHEIATGHYENRFSLLYRLKETLLDFLRLRQRKEIEKAEELKKSGEEAAEKNRENEEQSKRDEERRIQEEEELKRPYHDSRSGDILQEKVKVAQLDRAESVKQQLNLILSDPSECPKGGEHILAAVARDVYAQQALQALIEQSPGAAEVVTAFINPHTNAYGTGRELIKQAQRLSYEAHKINLAQPLAVFFEAINQQVQSVIKQEFMEKLKSGRRRGEAPVENLYDYLTLDKDIVFEEAEKDAVSDWEKDQNGRENVEQTWTVRWAPAIESLIKQQRSVKRGAELANKPDLVVASDKAVAKKIVAPVDEIWANLERIETTGDQNLKKEDLLRFERDIHAAQSKYHPKDVPAGSEAYGKALNDFRGYTEDKLNELAKRLNEQIKRETPNVKGGIQDQQEFLTEIVKKPGHFGFLLSENPEMNKLFFSTGEQGGKFRDKVFLKIHSAVLSDQRNQSNDNFGLYQRADFTTFIDLIRIGFKDITLPKTGEKLGQTVADYYNNLSNAIRQSRDIDFYATQPGLNMESFQKSFTMFQNEYTYQMMSMPAVVAAFRAYETSLKSIIDSSDGYLPPALLEYDARRKGSIWEQKSREMLKQMIEAGTVSDIYRDPFTYLHETKEDGVMLKKGGALENDKVDDDERMMYMVLAKGLGIASARYFEIMAQTKVPGSKNAQLGMDCFHSIPYENLVKALNYMNVYFSKWRMGSYKYFHLMNMAIPDADKKITINQNDPSQAWKAYMAYQDGTFEEKFGKGAKRFIDMTNFSGISSAIGKDTSWRQLDGTIIWPDKKKEKLGAGTRLTLAKRYAEEKVKELLVTAKYKEMYREEIKKKNAANPNFHLPESGYGFEKLWLDNGLPRWDSLISKEWDMLKGLDPERGKEHSKVAHDTEHLINAYKKAFEAKVWVEMAMRNPLNVGHTLKVEWPYVAAEGKKKVKLHNLLVQEILGIPPEDTKFGELFDTVGKAATPTDRQLKYIEEVLRLEGDLAAVRQIAITEGRDLNEGDFDRIKNETNRKQALDYWKKVKQVILGGHDAQHLYEEFGFGFINDTTYAWDAEKIHHLDKHLENLEADYKGNALIIRTIDGVEEKIPFLLKQALGTEFEWIIGTDDMALDEMDWLNLGSRQWIRRAGDIASHEAGGNAVVDYITHGLLPTPDKHKAAEFLTKVRDAYSGDMIEIGWNVSGNLAYMTDRLFAWDWGLMGSAAQVYAWRQRRGVAAWLANERREWWDTLEHADLLPPHGHFYFYDTNETNIHKLREWCHATDWDAIKEMILLGLAAAMLITVWRGITAKDEEEGGGGGGGHH